MKKYLTIIAALVALSASPVEAKAKEGGLTCTMSEVQMWEAPDLDGIEIWLGLRVSCHNTGKSAVRIKTADVTVIPDLDTDYQFSPTRNRDTIFTVFDAEPSPISPGKFLDIAPGVRADFAYVFVGGSPLTSLEGTLDLDSLKLRYKRKPTPTYFDVMTEEQKAEQARRDRIWNYE